MYLQLRRTLVAIAVLAVITGCGSSHSSSGAAVCLPNSPAGDYSNGLCGAAARAYCNQVFTSTEIDPVSTSTLQACSPFVRDLKARRHMELEYCNAPPPLPPIDPACVSGNFPPYNPKTAG
jgi:hypothetical protein